MTTVERITDTQRRLGLGRGQMAAYLGVPRGTLANWLDGRREPPPMVGRLLDVLAALELHSPTAHARLLASVPPDGRTTRWISQ